MTTSRPASSSANQSIVPVDRVDGKPRRGRNCVIFEADNSAERIWKASLRSLVPRPPPVPAGGDAAGDDAAGDDAVSDDAVGFIAVTEGWPNCALLSVSFIWFV